MATTPVIEKVQIWFHFLNLAHKSKNPELIALLDANKSKYEKWGNYRTMSWTKWWKGHSHLFATQKVQVITEEDEFPADTFVISIPFDKSKSQAGNTVKRLYGKAVEERGRVARLSQFKFSINPKTGKEHLVYAEKMRTYLAYAQEVYVPITNTGLSLSAKELLDKSIAVLEKIKVRKRSTQRGRAKNALLEQIKIFDNKYNAVQQINRMNMYVENLLFNVAVGKFPGVYNVKRNRPKLKVASQMVAKAVAPKSSGTRYMQKKKQTNALYGSWSPARRASHEKNRKRCLRKADA